MAKNTLWQRAVAFVLPLQSCSCKLKVHKKIRSAEQAPRAKVCALSQKCGAGEKSQVVQRW